MIVQNAIDALIKDIRRDITILEALHNSLASMNQELFEWSQNVKEEDEHWDKLVEKMNEDKILYEMAQ